MNLLRSAGTQLERNILRGNTAKKDHFYETRVNRERY